MKRLLILVTIGIFASTVDATAKPNVVFILADDLGYGDVGCYGGSVPTPQIDRLTVFWRARRGQTTWRAVRDGSLKFVSRTDGSTVKEYLFDLNPDLAEQQNLLDERAADAARLQALLKRWEEEVRPTR